MKVRTLLAAVLLPAALLGPTALRAQDLVKDALQSFPTQSVRLEYSNSAKLRKLPDYTVLRQRYLGPQLQKLEKSLSQLGIQESDVDELVLGWQAGSSGLDLNGLALGRFAREPHIGNDQRELVAVASHGEHHPKVTERAINDEARRPLDGVALVTENVGGQEQTGEEQTKQKAEGGGGKCAQGKTLQKSVDQDDDQGEDHRDQNAWDWTALSFQRHHAADGRAKRDEKHA